MKAKAQAISMKGIQSNITITLYFSRLLVQDLDSFSVFPFPVTFQKVDGEPKAIAMRLFVFPQRKFQTACLVSFIFFFGGGGRHDHWLNEPITPFSFFPPLALFLAPQI
jgi:hypothetical protein